MWIAGSNFSPKKYNLLFEDFNNKLLTQFIFETLLLKITFTFTSEQACFINALCKQFVKIPSNNEFYFMLKKNPQESMLKQYDHKDMLVAPTRG